MFYNIKRGYPKLIGHPLLIKGRQLPTLPRLCSTIGVIGLTEHLSPTRSNGLLAVIKQIRFYAIAYKAKEQQSK